MNAALEADESVVSGQEEDGGFLLARNVTRGSTRLSALQTCDAVLPIVAALIAANPRWLNDVSAE